MSVSFPSTNTEKLAKAAAIGDLAATRHLISLGGFTSIDNALSEAAENGHTACVQALLSVATCPPQSIIPSLTYAALNGHAACLELLLPHTATPSDSNSALLLAINRNDEKCLSVLWTKSDPELLLQSCNPFFVHERQAMQYISARLQHEQLHASIPAIAKTNPTKTSKI